MKKKQRIKAEIKQRQEKKKFAEKRRKREENRNSRDDMSLSSAFGICIALLFILIIGWCFYINHLEEEVYKGVIEPALAEPYYTWVKDTSFFYWGIGIISLIGIFATEPSTTLEPSKKEFISSFFRLMILLLAGLGFHGTYLIALIKLHVPVLAFVYFGLLLILCTISGFLYIKESNKFFHFIGIYIFITAFVSGLFLLFADSAEGNYMTVVKGSVQGSFSTKSTAWVIGMFGAGVLLFVITSMFSAFDKYYKKETEG